jgi:hypothetical protein
MPARTWSFLPPSSNRELRRAAVPSADRYRLQVA